MVASPDLLLLSAELVSLGLLVWLVQRSQVPYSVKLLAALIVFIEGISIALLISAVPRLFGFLLMVVGGFFLYRLLENKPEELSEHESLATGLLRKISVNGKLVRYFPAFGLALIVVDIIANFVYFNGRLGSNDLVVICMGLVYVSYKYIPERYDQEREFIFIFINILTILLVIPITIYNLLTGNSTTEGGESLAESKAVSFFLAQPLDSFLSILGYEVQAIGGTLYYQDSTTDGSASVSIAQGCSGIYSAVIFISAFLAWVVTEYQVFDRLVALLLILGILTAYLANLLRMSIIVLVGHYRGPADLEWAHANVGWMIFLVWIGLFWWLIFNFLIIQTNSVLSPSEPDQRGGE